MNVTKIILVKKFLQKLNSIFPGHTIFKIIYISFLTVALNLLSNYITFAIFR